MRVANKVIEGKSLVILVGWVGFGFGGALFDVGRSDDRALSGHASSAYPRAASRPAYADLTFSMHR